MSAIKVLFIIPFIAVASFASANTHEEIYGIHLYFDEKEFVDEMTISHSETGELSGRMHVPNDFDGDLENLKIKNNEIAFDLLVPRNAARPKDLVFQYRGQFFDQSRNQLIGFVTTKSEKDFVASFIAFRRIQPQSNKK